MSTYLAEAEQADTDLAGTRPQAGLWIGSDIEDDRQMSPARGIMVAMLIAIPFWVLAGIIIYNLA